MTPQVRVPVIKLRDVLLVPMREHLDDRAMIRLVDEVGERIANDRAAGVIIDVSGVDILDSFMTRTIRDLALSARLMGAITYLTGLQAAVAMTLVEMGLDLPGVRTTLNLDRALAEFERESARRKLADLEIEESLVRG